MKGVLLLLIVLLSCNNIDNKQRKEFSNKDEAVNFAISNLRKQDNANIYDLYYIIPTKELLYVINTNEKFNPGIIYFYKTTNTFNDVGEYIINVDLSSIDIKIPNYLDGTPITELKGMIFKKSTENNIDKYTLIKEGD